MHTDTICTLANLPGVSSWEDAVRDYLRTQAELAGCRTETDRLGNLLVYKQGRQHTATPVLLAAHMDEVGLMITHIEEEGYLRFDLVGAPDRRVLIGKRVCVNGTTGVIGIKAIHLVDREERKKTPPTDQLYIDIGAPNRTEAQKVVAPGDVAWFPRTAAPFGRGLVKGPALTSRIPCAILLELLKKELPVDVTVAFTVQQEVGSRGAFGTAFRLCPHTALVLDTVPAGDVPGSEAGPSLGSGVGIALRDAGTLYHSSLTRSLLTLAKEREIPAVPLTQGSASQSGTLQRSREGCAVAALKLPLRYPHTPSCVADPKDAEAALRLLEAFLQQQV